MSKFAVLYAAACVCGILIASILLASAEVRYDHHQLLRLPIALINRNQSILDGCSIWSHAHDSQTQLVLVPEDKVPVMQNALVYGESIDVVNSNIQTLLDAESKRLTESAKTRIGGTSATASVDGVARAMAVGDGEDWFGEFRSYNEILAWAAALAAKYPTLVTYTPSIGGTTVQGRDIFSLQISGKGGLDAKKGRVYLQALLHAREWQAAASALYMAHYLATSYKSSDTSAYVTRLLDTVVFVIIPVANPDGYLYTWAGDRLWRKNMALNATGALTGVDLNRNMPQKWDIPGGSSTDPKSDIYRGPTPSSEPETRALCAYFDAQPNVIAAVDIHTFSQLILRPNSWIDTPAPDEDNLRRISEGMRDTIARERGIKYTAQRSYDLYPVSGDQVSYWRTRGNATNPLLALGMELSPDSTKGAEGFISDPTEIVKVGQEVAKGLAWMAGQAGGVSAGSRNVAGGCGGAFGILVAVGLSW